MERSRGFSLLEAIFVLALAAILMALATPSISQWVANSQAQALKQQLLGTINHARSIALNMSTTVTICNIDGTRCSKPLKFPLSVFEDLNRNAIREEGEALYRVMDFSVPEGTELGWNRQAGYLRFWPSGGTGALTGSITYCNRYESDNDFRLVVARTGRVRVDEKETRC